MTLVFKFLYKLIDLAWLAKIVIEIYRQETDVL